jgi:glycosyltransferase involved in cell wall biosynthesis
MKFAFIESFLKKEWNGYTARYVNGTSGTHTSIYYLAEALSKKKHDVTIIQTQCNFTPKKVNGVFYQSMENIPEDDDTHYDVLIFTFSINDMVVLDKIKNFDKVAFLMACTELHSTHHMHPLYHVLNVVDFRLINMLYVSETSKLNAFRINKRIEGLRHHLVYNSIDVKDFTNSKGELYTYPEEKKENIFVFFACIERGFNIVLEVAKKINGEYQFSIASEGKFNIVTSNYDNKKYSHKIENVNVVHPKNTSKQEILEWNRKSKYFVYPLINTNNNVMHYDTFAYVVLEALLCGTIVIAPRMRVFEELYGDAIYYIDTTGVIENDDLIHSHFYDTKSCNVCLKENKVDFWRPLVDRYANAVQELENDVELRKTYVNRGFSLKDKFSNEKIADRIVEFFSN